MAKYDFTAITMAVVLLCASIVHAQQRPAMSPIDHYNRGIHFLTSGEETRDYAKAYAHLTMAVESGKLPGDLPMMAKKSLEKLITMATPGEIEAGKKILEGYRGGEEPNTK